MVDDLISSDKPVVGRKRDRVTGHRDVRGWSEFLCRANDRPWISKSRGIDELRNHAHISAGMHRGSFDHCRDAALRVGADGGRLLRVRALDHPIIQNDDIRIDGVDRAADVVVGEHAPQRLAVCCKCGRHSHCLHRRRLCRNDAHIAR